MKHNWPPGQKVNGTHLPQQSRDNCPDRKVWNPRWLPGNGITNTAFRTFSQAVTLYYLLVTTATRGRDSSGWVAVAVGLAVIRQTSSIIIEMNETCSCLSEQNNSEWLPFTDEDKMKMQYAHGSVSLIWWGGGDYSSRSRTEMVLELHSISCSFVHEHEKMAHNVQGGKNEETKPCRLQQQELAAIGCWHFSLLLFMLHWNSGSFMFFSCI